FNQISLWFVIIIIFRELLITGLRSIVAAEGVVIAAESLGKWKTATQMAALTLIILIPFNFTANNILLLIPLILTIVSGVEYVLKCKNVLNK
ncbi:MAG: CDP-alcohol phosphatidyltransferase family protein, partial [Leptotrichia hofstadii]